MPLVPLLACTLPALPPYLLAVGNTSCHRLHPNMSFSSKASSREDSTSSPENTAASIFWSRM